MGRLNQRIQSCCRRRSIQTNYAGPIRSSTNPNVASHKSCIASRIHFHHPKTRSLPAHPVHKCYDRFTNSSLASLWFSLRTADNTLLLTLTKQDDNTMLRIAAASFFGNKVRAQTRNCGAILNRRSCRLLDSMDSRGFAMFYGYPRGRSVISFLR
jgi:hypothetical protein